MPETVILANSMGNCQGGGVYFSRGDFNCSVVQTQKVPPSWKVVVGALAVSDPCSFRGR